MLPAQFPGPCFIQVAFGDQPWSVGGAFALEKQKARMVAVGVGMFVLGTFVFVAGLFAAIRNIVVG